ncbi:hypothetical protein K470DRAFT_257474 [Piedraia hortae CBS 480.64]|uniref:GYF domain-containing protein n=1 Tax=Piedraia hortae CBS 480.64 TaxID=1314780 RepID=A0A6A7C121_9PEZI|nr:hypothetical protein K470DRAFT_257474 [Piedraia hortae CBS 480.64]
MAAKRSLNGSDQSASSKRIRFDSTNPTELAAEGSEGEGDPFTFPGPSVKHPRNKSVNADDYADDSDPEDPDDVAARRKDINTVESNDEDNEDMFAPDDTLQLPSKRQTKEKSVRFLDTTEIYGQDMSSKDADHISGNAANYSNAEVSSDDDSDTASDGERAEIPADMDPELGAGSKKKHAPRVEAFNLKQEEEEGRFDQDGNFIRRADPDAEQDQWLEGVNKKEIKRAREAHQKRENVSKQKAAESDAETTGNLLADLIRELNLGETGMEALQRLGKLEQSAKRKKGFKQTGGETDEGAAARKDTVARITHAAETLLGRGYDDVWDLEREDLARLFSRTTGEEWTEPLWEFRWKDHRDGDKVHGPFERSVIDAWKDAGYFDNAAEVRVGGGPWGKV